MKNNFFLKFLSSFWFRSGLIASITIAAAFSIVMAADYYQVVNNAVSVMIQEHGKCRYIKNSRAQSIFVPTKTAAEWDAFIGQTDYSGTLSIYNCYYCSLGSTYPSLITCNNSCSQSATCNATPVWASGSMSFYQHEYMDIRGMGQYINFSRISCVYSEYGMTRTVTNLGNINLAPGVSVSGAFVESSYNNGFYVSASNNVLYLQGIYGSRPNTCVGTNIGYGTLTFTGATVSVPYAPVYLYLNDGWTNVVGYANGFYIQTVRDGYWNAVAYVTLSSGYTCPYGAGYPCNASNTCTRTGTCSVLP